jgi:hypothetical protein
MHFQQGQHYWGVVEGNLENSLAAVSISDSEISGIVTVDGEQYALGKMKHSDQEIFYPTANIENPVEDRDVLEVPDTEPLAYMDSFGTANAGSDEVCVKLYIEAESNMFDHHGDVETT